MLAGEPITDPNVAAFLVRYAGMRLVVANPLRGRMSWWGRAFTWAPWPPQGEPSQPRRVGRTIYVDVEFRRRMELYLNSHKLEARQRLSENR